MSEKKFGLMEFLTEDPAELVMDVIMSPFDFIQDFFG